MSHWQWFALLCLFSVLPAGIASAQPAEILVRGDDLACVLGNVSEYERSRRKPLVIVMEKCPPAPLAPRGPFLPRSPQSSPGEPESVLVLTHEELACLKQREEELLSGEPDVISLVRPFCR